MSRTWVCVPSPPRWIKVGAYYCGTRYCTAGWWRSNHRPKKYFFGNRTLTHFCIFVIFLQCGNVANSKNDFCSLCMSMCVFRWLWNVAQCARWCCRVFLCWRTTLFGTFRKTAHWWKHWTSVVVFNWPIAGKTSFVTFAEPNTKIRGHVSIESTTW